MSAPRTDAINRGQECQRPLRLFRSTAAAVRGADIPVRFMR